MHFKRSDQFYDVLNSLYGSSPKEILQLPQGPSGGGDDIIILFSDGSAIFNSPLGNDQVSFKDGSELPPEDLEKKLKTLEMVSQDIPHREATEEELGEWNEFWASKYGVQSVEGPITNDMIAKKKAQEDILENPFEAVDKLAQAEELLSSILQQHGKSLTDEAVHIIGRFIDDLRFFIDRPQYDLFKPDQE